MYIRNSFFNLIKPLQIVKKTIIAIRMPTKINEFYNSKVLNKINIYDTNCHYRFFILNNYHSAT